MRGKARTHRVHEGRIPHLTDEEQQVVAQVLDRLASVAEYVERVILFGSKARGDSDMESDIDLLIVTRDGKAQVDAALQKLDVGAHVLTLLVRSAKEYAEWQRLQPPLYINLRREGIELWDPQAWKIEQARWPLSLVEGELRTMDAATKETIRTYMGLAYDGLEAARYLRKGGYLRHANSKAYYAAHYALVAALYALNVVRSKHSAIEAALSQFLVKPGHVEQEFKDIFVRLRKRREDSDYEPDFTPREEETDRLLADAERFVARMEAFLRTHGALD